MCKHNAAVSAADFALLIANMKIISQYLPDYNRFSCGSGDLWFYGSGRYSIRMQKSIADSGGLFVK